MYRWETRMLLKHYLEQGVSQSELARRFGIDSTTFCRFSGRVRGRPIEESTASSTSEADSGTCQRGLEVNSETHVREPRTNGYPKVRLLVRIDRSGGESILAGMRGEPDMREINQNPAVLGGKIDDRHWIYHGCFARLSDPQTQQDAVL